MKKKPYILMFLLVGLLALPACSKEPGKSSVATEDSAKEDSDTTEWVKEDFYVYDLNGKLIDYPLNNGRTYDYTDPEALKIQTSKGVKINDSAKVALADYDFTNFIVEGSQWPLFGSLDAQQEVIKKKFAEKYPNKNDRVLHNEELSLGMGLFICGSFYEEDGKLYSIPTDSSGERFEDCSIYPQYEISFRISKGKVAQIAFSHYESYDMI